MENCNRFHSIVSSATMGGTLCSWGDQWYDPSSLDYYTNPIGYGYFPYWGENIYSYAGYHINNTNSPTDICDFYISNCDGLWYPGGIDGTGDYKITNNGWIYSTGNYSDYYGSYTSNFLTSYSGGESVEFNYPYPALTNYGAETDNVFFGYIGFIHGVNILSSGEEYTNGYSVGRISIGNIDIYDTRGIGGSGLDGLYCGYNQCVVTNHIYTLKINGVVYENTSIPFTKGYIYYHPTSGLIINGYNPYTATLINLDDRIVTLSHDICTTNAYNLFYPQFHFYKPCISEKLDCSGDRTHCITELTSSMSHPYGILEYYDNPYYLPISKPLPMHAQLTIGEAEFIGNDPYYSTEGLCGEDTYTYSLGIINLTYTFPSYNYTDPSGYRLDDEHPIDLSIDVNGSYKYFHDGECHDFSTGSISIQVTYSGYNTLGYDPGGYNEYSLYFGVGLKDGNLITTTTGYHRSHLASYAISQELCADIVLPTLCLYYVDDLLPSGLILEHGTSTIYDNVTGFNPCLCDYTGPVGTHILRQDDPSNGEFLGGPGQALLYAYGKNITWDGCPTEYSDTNIIISGVLYTGLGLYSVSGHQFYDAVTLTEKDENNYYIHAYVHLINYDPNDWYYQEGMILTGSIAKNRIPLGSNSFGFRFRPEIGDYVEGYLYANSVFNSENFGVYRHWCTLTLLD